MWPTPNEAAKSGAALIRTSCGCDRVIHAHLCEVGASLGVEVDARQSAHEGQLVDWIGGARDDGFVGIVINPGAYAHTSIAIHDAIKGSGLPVIEVHLSNTDAREKFRRRALTARACRAKVSGFGALSYELGLTGLVRCLPTV